MSRRDLVYTLLFSVALNLAQTLFLAVFMTGSTFQQRCAEYYPTRSAEWARCIEDLSAGRDIGEAS